MPREVLGRRLAHVANAQRVDEAREGRVLAFLDRRKDIGRRFVGHALESRKLDKSERVDIGRRPHVASVDQLLDQLVPESLDIESPPARKM